VRRRYASLVTVALAIMSHGCRLLQFIGQIQQRFLPATPHSEATLKNMLQIAEEIVTPMVE